MSETDELSKRLDKLENKLQLMKVEVKRIERFHNNRLKRIQQGKECKCCFKRPKEPLPTVIGEKKDEWDGQIDVINPLKD